MSSTTPTPAPASAPPIEKIRIRIDGRSVEVPRQMPDWQGNLQPTTMLQACHLAGVEVPHYCYHPKLPIAGNCRMCLVEFGMPAIGPDRQPILGEDGNPKIVRQSLPYDPSLPRGAIACATPISPGMEIFANSKATKQMREAVLESLLINHPLDCPICDQAGECKLQEYSVDYGQATSHFAEVKVHKPKAVDLGPRILLDDERCILCTRCIRFSRDIVGDDALGIVNRGSYNSISSYPGKQFDNNYSLNTVDICPVGALTSKDFRFQMRVWFLKESKSVCASCATGCNIIVGSREERIYRFTPRDNDAVNAGWMCDYGRLNYKWLSRPDRLTEVKIKRASGTQQLSNWSEAIQTIATKLTKAEPESVAIVASGRQTNEELYLLAKLAAKLKAISDIVPRTGAKDSILLNADRNPNSTGARLIGVTTAAPGEGLVRIGQGIRRGQIRTLLVFGEDISRHGFDEKTLGKIECLIVSDLFPSSLTPAADFVLPACAHLEKRGTFTNAKGRVQKFLKAVEPPGDARPEWEFLHELVFSVTGQNGFVSIEGLFNQMASEVPAFAGLSWAALGDTGASVPL